MKVKIKLFENGKMPKQIRKGDVCFDCYSRINTTVKKGNRTLIPLGFALELPENYEAVIRPRSGMSKNGIDVPIGTIDTNYRGEVMGCIINNSDNDYQINVNDRICQLAIRKVPDIEFEEVSELTETERNSNGFGSSGK